jgi:hypothetical protein
MQIAHPLKTGVKGPKANDESDKAVPTTLVTNLDTVAIGANTFPDQYTSSATGEH